MITYWKILLKFSRVVDVDSFVTSLRVNMNVVESEGIIPQERILDLSKIFFTINKDVCFVGCWSSEKIN